MNEERRVLLKVMAACPLLACSGSYVSYGESAGGGGVAELGGATGVGGAGSASAGSGAAMPGATPAGNLSTTKIGTLLVVPNAPVILGRDAQGLYAMTISCPHQGCDVTPQGNALYCPCHGSRFDSNGGVVKGPARSPLVHFAVSVDAAGNITVHLGSTVASSVRTMVA
jgi:nitrite reductase/ring-hydroxylating ferredoxin subunit